MKKTIIFAGIVALATINAQASSGHEGHVTPSSASAEVSASKTTPSAAAALSEGEDKKVDKDMGKVTIKHGPLKNLDMPGMTMVFKAADAALLDTVKVGDKIRFLAENKGGALMVTHLERAESQ